MARIRSVKPEFFKSAKIGQLSPEARLLFVGTWTEADDAGRLLGSAKHLAGAIFPFDDRATEKRVEEWLGELLSADLLVAYESRGARYFFIPTWQEHQRISNPSPAKFPSPNGEATEFFGSDSATATRGKGREGKGVGKEGSRKVSDAAFDRFWDAYPRKVAKGAAKKSWDVRIDSGVDPDALIRGAERYSGWVAAGGVESARFVCHPATWLNQGREEDELTRSPSAEPKGFASLRAIDEVIEEGRRGDIRRVEADSSRAARGLPAASDPA